MRGGFFIQASLEKQDGSWCSHPGFGVALEIAGEIDAKTNSIIPDPSFGFSRPNGNIAAISRISSFFCFELE